MNKVPTSKPSRTKKKAVDAKKPKAAEPATGATAVLADAVELDDSILAGFSEAEAIVKGSVDDWSTWLRDSLEEMCMRARAMQGLVHMSRWADSVTEAECIGEHYVRSIESVRSLELEIGRERRRSEILTARIRELESRLGGAKAVTP